MAEHKKKKWDTHKLNLNNQEKPTEKNTLLSAVGRNSKKL